MAENRMPLGNYKDFSHCYGCGQDNPFGLKLKVSWDGRNTSAEFRADEVYQGWPGIVHGGVLSALLDEVMSYVPHYMGIVCVTGRTQLKYRNMAPTKESYVITATGLRKKSQVLETRGTVSLKSGSLVLEGTSLMYVLEERKKSQAVLWDMDGVIADTAPFHLASWQEVLGKRGVKFTAEDFRRTFGQRNDTIIRGVLGDAAPTVEIEAIARDKEESFRCQVQGNLRPLPGVLTLLQQLSREGYRLALASSAPLANLQMVCGALGISPFFQAVVSDGDVSRGKPDPEVFLTAAKWLWVKPENCLVIEDSLAGVEAARKAGMKALAVSTTNPPEELKGADLVVDNLDKVDTSLVEKLLGICKSQS